MRIDVDVDGLRETRETVVTLDDDVDKAMDDAVEDIADDVNQNMTAELFRQGSVKTGEGYRSLRTADAGKGRTNVIGRSYLVPLDKGSTPHNPRVNHRLRFWAASEGWEVSQIVQHIQRYGTRPHPFIDVSVDRAVIQSDDVALKNIKKRIDS